MGTVQRLLIGGGLNLLRYSPALSERIASRQRRVTLPESRRICMLHIGFTAYDHGHRTTQPKNQGYYVYASKDAPSQWLIC